MVARFLIATSLALAIGGCSKDAPVDTNDTGSVLADVATDDADMGLADAATADMTNSPDTTQPGADMPEAPDMDTAFSPVSLQSEVTGVQPMTGIVLWEDSWNDNPAKDAVQLEYAYIKPSDIVTAADTYDWAGFDVFLDRIAGRQH